MIRDIAYFLASIFIFGAVYWLINVIVSLVQTIFILDDTVVIGVYFLWTIVPIVYYVGKIREFMESRNLMEAK